MRILVDKELPEVRPILKRTKAFGAEASRSSRGYYVQLNAALPAILHYTFNNLLRIPSYMSGVGDTSAETPYRDLHSGISFFLPRGMQVEKAIYTIAGLSRPKDNQRAQAAVLLTELATAFCAYHEVAHIMLGHVDANAQLNSSLHLVEVVPICTMPAGKVAAMRRVWEFEADLVAANMLLQDMVSPGTEEAFMAAFGPESDYSPVARVQAMLGAALVVFLLVSQSAPASKRTHPDPLVRFIAIANDSAAALVEQQPNLGLSIEEMQEAVNDVAAAILDAWLHLQVPSRYRSPAARMLSARVHVEKLQQQRLEFYEVYSGYAYLYPFK